MKQTEQIFSRVRFCESCYKSKRPKQNELFLVFGSEGFHVYKAGTSGELGFTPHVLYLIKAIGENVVYEYCCGFCGVSFSRKKDYDGNEWIHYKINTVIRGMTDIKTWNNWILYYDRDYFVEGLDPD